MTKYQGSLVLALVASLGLVPGCSSEADNADALGASAGSGGRAASAGSGGQAASSGVATTGGSPTTTGGSTDLGGSAGSSAGTASESGAAGEGGEGGAPEPEVPCSTRITYGNTWIRGADRETDFDVVDADVTWDGQCMDEGGNSFALLSNGFKPYFRGHAGCIIALDHSNCESAGQSCRTRIGYGESWQAPAGRMQRYDQVNGAVTWNGACSTSSATSSAKLSNGWSPHFTGTNACSLGFGYQECGGLYMNPVIPEGCADPGVLLADGTYYVACTGGGSSTAFALKTSTDLAHFTGKGHVFTSATKPAWTKGDYWAPELHRVNGRYVAYYTARHQDGRLSIGAASATDPLGPYTDLGKPLVQEPGIGAIDATYFQDGAGQPYLSWKIDGNAQSKPTPIYGQKLAADGMSLVGTRTELITNDQDWEGHVVEGPWVIREGDYYYLFYSGNSYANASYAVGVARSKNPLGPYEKHGAPILVSNERWVGPGHCSVVRGPRGAWQMVYHAWPEPRVGGRVTLVDPLRWADGWPSMPQTPSLRSVPLP